MTVNYFDVDKGFSIDEGAVVVTYGNGTGSLGGATTATHPIGTLFIDNATGNVYNRTASAANTLADWDLQASQAYVASHVASQLATQVSWREPVEVRDNTTTTTAAMNAIATGGNPATVDGETITDGERVLFSALTDGGGKNVYIYDQTAGTFTEDTNLETTGDTVYVKSGTNAGTRYTYNGTDWVLTDLSSSDELGFIRTFVGKSGVGFENPTYTSINVVTNAPPMSLETAIGALDATYGDGLITNITGNYSLSDEMVWNAAGTLTLTAALNELNNSIGDATYTSDFNVTDGQSIAASIDALDLAIGNRTYTNDYIVTDSQSVTASIDAIDTAMGNGEITNDGGNWALTDDLSWGAAGTLTVTTALDNLNAAIGDRTYTEDNYVTDGQSIAASINALDIALGDVEVTTPITGSGTLSAQSVDSFAHNGNATQARWMILIRESGSTTNVEALEVHALIDGSTSADHTVYGKLKGSGGKVTGLVINVTTDGTNANLVLTTGVAVNYVIKRVHTLSF